MDEQFKFIEERIRSRKQDGRPSAVTEKLVMLP